MSFGGGPKHGMAGLFGKESSTNYDVYLNLTPLMDVMSNILFFLLASFGSTLVAVLPTTVPLRASDGAPMEAEEQKVTLTLRADATGFTVGADNPSIAPEVLKEFSVQIPKKGDQYDFPTLTAMCKRVKERYPQSKTMVLVPDDDIRYEVIVKIMDAAREYKLPDNRKLLLFEEVVYSSTPASEKKK